MHKLQVKLYITVVLLFLSIACVRSPRHAEQIMEQAKSCMNESADSALHNLDTKQIFKVKGKWSGGLSDDVNDITYETVNLGTGKVVSTYSRKAGYK